MAAITSIHLYPSDFLYETRIFNEAIYIHQEQLAKSVVLCGVEKNGLSEKQDFCEGIQIVRIQWPKFANRLLNRINWLKNLAYNLSAYTKFKNYTKSVIHVQSVWQLPVGVKLAEKNENICIYDAQELESERAGFNIIKKKIANFLEQYYIPKVSAVITSSKGFAENYRNKFPNKEIYVLRNIPFHIQIENIEDDYLRKKFSIDAGLPIYVFHGFLTSGRGIKMLLDVFSQENLSADVVFIGYGPLLSEIKAFESRCKNIHYHEPVSTKKLFSILKTANAGLITIEPISNSYLLCQPNKIFECLFAGVPVLATNLPGLSEILSGKKYGWLINADKESISNFIQNASIEYLNQNQPSIAELELEYNYSSEASFLKNIYNKI